MDLRVEIINFLPMWIFALLFIFYIRQSEYKNIMRFNVSAIMKFFYFMLAVTIGKLTYFHFFSTVEDVRSMKALMDFIPWQFTLGTFWEDTTTSLPIVLLDNMLSNRKIYKFIRLPFLIMTMIAFGSGHMYQGIIAASVISFYVPLSIVLGKKYGFATVMAGHIMFDLLTWIFMKLVVTF